jgi:hypothetical protein
MDVFEANRGRVTTGVATVAGFLADFSPQANKFTSPKRQ